MQDSTFFRESIGLVSVHSSHRGDAGGLYIARRSENGIYEAMSYLGPEYGQLTASHPDHFMVITYLPSLVQTEIWEATLSS